jgi:hypothetical protein
MRATGKTIFDGLRGVAKIGFALILIIMIKAVLTVPHAEGQWVNDPMLHNSTNLNSSAWGTTGWGIPGGKYGAWTCETCHIKSTTNIKRIRTTITSSSTDTWPNNSTVTGNIIFLTADTISSDMGSTSTVATGSWSGVCNVCHAPSKHTYYSYNSYSTGAAHNTGKDCTQCHSHKSGFSGGDCLSCHASVKGGVRTDVANQFADNSHHVQGVTITNQHCYNCHWEAKADGSPDTAYHTQTPGQPVDLVVWGTNTIRPTTYSGNVVTYLAGAQTRSEIAKITTVCLGCHNDTLASTSWNVKPFGDGKAPNYYAWDGSSVASRYTQTGTTNWGKYSSGKTAKKLLTKAFSAHGNAAANQLGWDKTQAVGWVGGMGVDSTLTNFTGSTDIECFDCHNSHGSSAGNATTMTTNYTSSTQNGGLLKDTVASLGGYTATYKPTALTGATQTLAVYNTGGALCFDCHNTPSPTASVPWGYMSTFGSGSAIFGYVDKPLWYGTAGVNPAGRQLRFTYKNTRSTRGTHMGASSALTSTTGNNRINGLCTPCHDPHGVSKTNVGICSNQTNTYVKNQADCTTLGGTWTSTQDFGVPMLKGTWITSPYREDAGPPFQNESKGGGSDNSGIINKSTPGYNIDQNTFVTSTFGPVSNTTSSWDRWNFYSLATATSKVTHSANQFAGLCLKCHPKAQIKPTTTAPGGGWKTYDRIHNTVQGWSASTGSNLGNAIHGFTCSKCHASHSSCLPRLMITNCLDFNHRGRRATGGTTPTAGAFTGTSGRGNGRYPAGGGGYGRSPDAGTATSWPNSSGSNYYFGIPGVNSSSVPPLRNCHDVVAGGTWPNNQRWNSLTPW